MLGRIKEYLAARSPKEKVRAEKRTVQPSTATQKDMFFANMSHEIRTPVNGIVGFTQLLKETKLSKEQHELVDTIHASSMHLLGLVNDILDFSKINAHKMQLEETEFDLFRQVEDTVDSYAAAAQEKGISLALYLDPTIAPTLVGDPSKLSQILINLISNAVKFSDMLGEINVRVEKILEGQKMVTLRFSVRDLGIGISRGAQKNIFNAFAQANSSISRKFGGTGLGLAISSELVKLMGGELAVESEPDEGAEFYFTLAFEKVRSQERKIYADLYRGLSVGIMVAQKGSPGSTEKNLQAYLGYLGADTHFYSSVELVSMAKQVLPDLVFADDRNIGIDLRDLEALGTKVILLSAISRRSSVAQNRENICGNIYKPVNLTKTIRAFESCLESEEREEMTEKSAFVNRNFKGFKALVADDNHINQKLMLQVLENMQMDVALASDGEEVRELYEEMDPDIIFMDIQMPVMNGLEATEKILAFEREQEKRHVPIIALTGNIEKEDTERYIDAGMDGFLSKPVDVNILVSYLNRYLTAKQLVQQMERAEALFEGARALVVEGNSINRDLIERALASRGVESRTVSRASAVMEVYGEERFHILFISTSMPMVSTSDVIMKLRAYEAKQGRQSVPIVLIVPEETSEEHCDAYRKEGVAGFLFRPLDIDAIKMELDRCIVYDPQETIQEHRPSLEEGMLSDTATAILGKMDKTAAETSETDRPIPAALEEAPLLTVPEESMETESLQVLLSKEENAQIPKESEEASLSSVSEKSTEAETPPILLSEEEGEQTQEERVEKSYEAPLAAKEEDTSDGQNSLLEEDEVHMTPLLMEALHEAEEGLDEGDREPSAFLLEDHLSPETDAASEEGEPLPETVEESVSEGHTLKEETAVAYERALQELKGEEVDTEMVATPVETVTAPAEVDAPQMPIEESLESLAIVTETSAGHPAEVLSAEVQENALSGGEEEPDTEGAEAVYTLLHATEEESAKTERYSSPQTEMISEVPDEKETVLSEYPGITDEDAEMSREESEVMPVPTEMTEPEEVPIKALATHDVETVSEVSPEEEKPKEEASDEKIAEEETGKEEAWTESPPEEIPAEAPSGEETQGESIREEMVEKEKREGEETGIKEERPLKKKGETASTTSEEVPETSGSETKVEIVAIGETKHVVQYIDIPIST